MFANENIPAMKLKESNMSDTWYKGEPNGGRGENCAIMVKDATYDNPCESQHCGICDSPISPVFHMRGLCQKSNFDTRPLAQLGKIGNI